jgi:hypothetical protein
MPCSDSEIWELEASELSRLRALPFGAKISGHVCQARFY